jgi:capsular polysaccharide export protein
MGDTSVNAKSALPAGVLLRWPPFPGSRMDVEGAVRSEGLDRDTLFAALRKERVGGAFWGDPLAPEIDGDQPDAVARITPGEAASSLLCSLGFEEARIIERTHKGRDIDPWSILTQAQRLAAHGADEWVALASILNLEVTVLSPGIYGAPDDGPEDLKERAFHALKAGMPDPFGENWLDPLKAIALLGDWRRVLDGNRGPEGERLVAACGMNWWKRDEIRRFLWSPGAPLRFCRSNTRALGVAAKEGGAIAVWPSRVSPGLAEQASKSEVQLVRVEDGFVRSVGLGSNLVPPLSIIVDRQGIHYDPSRPSDLETILASFEFSPDLQHRAASLRQSIVEAGISKYAASNRPKRASAGSRGGTRDGKREGKRLVLVPGQVEDDMSVVSGGGGLTSNLELLRRTRALEPDAEIWWRPHPDVDAGHRVGAVADSAALEYADRIVREGSMSDLLDEVDALHTLTSLSGFEGLMRFVEVTCHGVPFYSGWGLTRDLGAVPSRRGRQLSLDELVAGVLLLYPRYLDPVTGLPCPPEILIQRLADGKATNRLAWVEPLRRMQGRIMRRLRPDAGR